MRLVRGGCHCRKFRFEVKGYPDELIECNCSICTMKGYRHWIVPRENFRLTAGSFAELREYRFNTMTARHYFCPVCGVTPFYIARSDPDKIDVNARCLDNPPPDQIKTIGFDGRNWEEAFRRWRGKGSRSDK